MRPGLYMPSWQIWTPWHSQKLAYSLWMKTKCPLIVETKKLASWWIQKDCLFLIFLHMLYFGARPSWFNTMCVTERHVQKFENHEPSERLLNGSLYAISMRIKPISCWALWRTNWRYQFASFIYESISHSIYLSLYRKGKKRIC